MEKIIKTFDLFPKASISESENSTKNQKTGRILESTPWLRKPTLIEKPSGKKPKYKANIKPRSTVLLSYDEVAKIPVPDKKQKPYDKTKENKAKAEKKKQPSKPETSIGPTYQEVLAEKKSLEEYRAKVEHLEQLMDQPLQEVITISDDEKPEIENYSCMDLGELALNIHFEKISPILKDIMSEKIPNHRHNKFHYGKANEVGLTFSTSIMVFNEEQREILLKLLEKRFDPNDKNNFYIFKVLFPELCLNIFMREHDMEREEAIEYLEKRPVDF